MPILIAVNPYKKLNLYTDSIIKSYKDYFNKFKSNPTEAGAPIPHLYHLAEAAYTDMINDKKNQSLIISGESGSGKTESTKIILKYLAVSSIGSQKDKPKENMITVEKQVLDSNPLLEAFGNAKTVKNNNSSRFGKFIQVSFTEHGKILSAMIYNYLLEKSRVVNIQKDERNYHIFYQLLLGANEQEREKYRIKDLDYYDYLSSGCFDIADTDDVENFKETKDCMKKLLFTDNEIEFVFNIIMGILYLGNVSFIEVSEHNTLCSKIDEEKEEDFENAAYFLGVTKETLSGILTTKKLQDQLSKQVITKYLSVEKAYNCRDAISKALYAKMFDYIVGKVNKAIANKDECGKYDKSKIRKIGLLDIFGFENFENNSFEQLCINYANERLQQYFNNHIFKMEQEEYKKEGIDWTQVEFVDNNDIIELIDANKISIFGLLDSEGITPNANDVSFRNNVYKLCSGNEALGEDSENALVINHYAGVIEYNISGFVEKNLDQLTNDISEALQQSTNKLIKSLFENKEKDKSKGKKAAKGPNKLQSDTLSKQFKTQLDELLVMLGQSNPRYVKCIKPNSQKEPKILDSIDVMDQLLCAGVLEAIKIRKQGYSIRRTKEEFYKAYRVLTPQVDIKNCKNFSEAVTKMLKLLGEIPEMKEALHQKKKTLQVGHNKVFMKEEVKAILDYKKNRIKYIYLLQSTFRGMKIRKKVRRILNAARKIQAVYKGRVLRDFVIELRKVSLMIQHNFRYYRLKRRIYKMIKFLIQKKIEREQEKMKLLQSQNPAASIPIEEPKNNYMTEISTNNIKSSNEYASAYNTNQISNVVNNNQDRTLRNGKPKAILNNNIISSNEDYPQKQEDKVKKKLKKGGGKKKINLEVQNMVDDELKKKLDELQKELEETQAERDKYKSLYEKAQSELQNKQASTVSKGGNSDEAVKKLKKEIEEKDTNYDILQMQNEELIKQNKNLAQLTDSLKQQHNKRKEKYEKEISSLYLQIQQLEIAKSEYERRLTQDTKQERDSKALINLNTNYRAISELKTENKELQKKLDDLRDKYNKEVSGLKSEIAIRDYKLNESSKEELNKIKKENEKCKATLQEMKVKLDNLNKNSKLLECGMDIDKMQNEYENQLLLKEEEKSEIKEENEKLNSTVEKMKKIEKVLRTQLTDKEAELENYKKFSEETREENEKILDENMELKKENCSLKSKIEVLDSQIKNRNDSDTKQLKLSISELNQKVIDYETQMNHLQSSYDKKTKQLENKKKMNLLLIELAKLKKSEVHCIEGLNLTNSSQLKQTLEDLRKQEESLLTQ